MPPKSNPNPQKLRAPSLSTNWKLEKRKNNPIITMMTPLPTVCQFTIIRSISYYSINESNMQERLIVTKQIPF